MAFKISGFSTFSLLFFSVVAVIAASKRWRAAAMFVGFFLVGFFYIIRKGALQWED
jgi:NADH-quinone oxidoreductase subunit A